jgi:peptidoglycan/xylan/chitin deacetylase (PgdA/CDA1 family)
MSSSWVLLYHEVLPESRSLWAVPPHDLAAAVDAARSAALRVTTLAGAFGGGDSVTVTFDDACLSVYENALPLLDLMNVPAAVFVPVDQVGAPGRMTWAHLDELARHGWAIESHGCSHEPLAAMSSAAVRRELTRSKRTIEDRLGLAVSCFAYPYGVPPACDERMPLEAVLAGAGYRLAVLAAGGAARSPLTDAFRVPREPVAPGQRLLFSPARLQA